MFSQFRLWLGLRLLKLASTVRPRTQKKKSDSPASKVQFSHLAPISDKENTSSYRNALTWALAQADIFNIAISGAYGSGKSTILKSFTALEGSWLKRNISMLLSPYKFLHISLATFKNHSLKDANNNVFPIQYENLDLDKLQSLLIHEKREDELHKLIELSILQQMLYKVGQDDIPESRFKRIKNIDFWGLWKWPTFIFLSGSSYLFLFNSRIRERILELEAFEFPTDIWLFLVVSIVGALSFYVGITLIVRFLYQMRFTKINLVSGEIEMTNGVDGSSILNRHIDEILYFFQRTKYNVVLIEDLDRFNNPEIFTKLRELNSIINGSKQIKKQVRFIYAIRENMFTDKQRTKFFDFIIPVIPHISASNSINKLIDKLRELEISNDELPAKFLYSVMLHIDDMRVLNNIVNEFLIYRQNLEIKKLGLSLSSLFGIIVYKNLKPADFADIPERKGNFYNAFSKRKEINQKISEGLHAQNKEIEEQLRQIEEESVTTVEELKRIYISECLMRIPQATHLYLPDKTPIGDLLVDEHFDQLRFQKNIDFFSPHTGRSSSGISFSSIEEGIDSKLTFAERVDIVTDKEAGMKMSISFEKSANEYELNLLRSQPIKRLFETIPDMKNYFPMEIQENELLIYLLREGYIDESYEYYLSYFYPNSLSTHDTSFIRRLRNLDKADYHFKLVNISEILHRTVPEDLLLDESLNISLTDFLISDSDNHTDYATLLWTKFRSSSLLTTEFISAYMQSGKNVKSFFLQCISLWPRIWEDISRTAEDDEILLITLRALILNLEPEDIKKLDSYTTIIDFIETLDARFLKMFKNENDIQRMSDFMTEFGIKLPQLYEEAIDFPAFTVLIIGGLYNFTFSNLFVIAKYYHRGKEFNNELFTLANYTSIRESDSNELKSLVESNMKEYGNVLATLESNRRENAESVKLLLTNSEIELADKKQIIKISLVKLPLLKSFDKSLWKRLIMYNRIEPTWHNVIVYYLEFGVEEVLIEFLTENVVLLGDQNISTNGHAVKLSKLFFIKLTNSADVDDDTFKALLAGIHYKISIPRAIKGLELPDDEEPEKFLNRITSLIDNSNINLTKENYTYLRKAGKDLQINLIKKNLEVFLESSGKEFPINQVELRKLLIEEDDIVYQRIVEYYSPASFSSADLATDVINRLASSRVEINAYDKLLILFKSSNNAIGKLRIFNKIAAKFIKSQNEGGPAYSQSQIEGLIPLIDQDYEAMLKRKGHAWINKSDEASYALEFMKTIGVIIQSTPRKKKISVKR